MFTRVSRAERGSPDSRGRRSSLDENEATLTAAHERIKKKEEELQQICTRIELMEKERDLDEKIKKAIDLETFLNKSSTSRKTDYENESENYMTTKDVENAFKSVELDDDGKRLFRFAVRTVAEENMRNRICDAELSVYLAHNSKVTISKGAPKQRMVIILDEKNDPVFRCEVNPKLANAVSTSYR